KSANIIILGAGRRRFRAKLDPMRHSSPSREVFACRFRPSGRSARLSGEKEIQERRKSKRVSNLEACSAREAVRAVCAQFESFALEREARECEPCHECREKAPRRFR